MPVKYVSEYQCERCNRVWYESGERKVANIHMEMNTSNGEVIKGDYEVLCETCEGAVANYARSLVKKMQKKGPKKSKAKEGEEEAEASSPNPNNAASGAQTRSKATSSHHSPS